MIAMLLSIAFGQQVPLDPPDLRENLGRGVSVNWTTLTLEVTRDGHGRGVGATRKAIEHDARDGLRQSVRVGADNVRVTSGIAVEDLLQDEVLSEAVSSRVSRWVVGEARYYNSGRIELVAELTLLDLLKPWNLANATPRPAEPRVPDLTGVVVDARGTGVTPAWAPRILSDGERLLWDGTVWDDVALGVAPVVWVADPSHPAVATAGDRPLVVRAERATGADLFLDPLDAARFRTAVADSELLREGTVVVVADP